MIAATAYYALFLMVVTMFSLIIGLRYSRMSATVDLRRGEHDIPMSFLVIAVIVFIGLRPESYLFVDMMNYVQGYHAFLEGTPFRMDWTAENFLFDNLFAWVGSQTLGTTFFFFVIAAIYFGAAWWGIRRLFPRDAALAYLAFLGAFSTFSYGTNGIKAGAAASLFILALSYCGKWVPCLVLMVVTLGFHHSMQMPLAAFVLALLWKNPKQFFWGWLFCLACAAAHVSFFQELFAGMTDESGKDYLNAVGSDWGGNAGFRIDFVLYSAMPVWVGWYAIYKHHIRSRMYDILLKVYLTTNAVWMLCMYASFTNRIAYLSWSIYPVVLIYPLCCEEWGPTRHRTLSRIFLAHLAFTIFMQWIYYGYVKG